MRQMFLIMIMTALTLSPHTAMAQNGRASCSVCGMYIDSHQKTAATLISRQGVKSQTCGVTDMIRLINDAGGPAAFSSLKVRGWNNGHELAAQDAVYVIGSRIIPDMLPTIIAFSSQKEAQKFQKINGGALLSFTQALLSISPTGMTMPVKIKSAVVPAQGATGFAAGAMYMKKDKVMDGSDHVDPADFIQRPGQNMGAKEMKTRAEMYMLSYGINNKLALGVSIKDLHKKMDMYLASGSKVSTTRNNGLSDLNINLRYNIWKDVYYSKFFTVLLGTTLPTGNFKIEYESSPGLQTGSGSLSGTAGLLYSQRLNDFWFHTMLTYTHKLENSDNYKFGDETNFGAALHYTPDYNLMIGLEINGTDYAKNEYNGQKLDNTGGFRSYATGVGSWRFLTALGGNFNLRLSISLPLYEDMNHYTAMGLEKAQLGGGYTGSALLSFKRRFAF